MSSKLLVSTRQLGKKYVLGTTSAATLRDRVTEVVRAIGRRRAPAPEFWALRDVSFDLSEGQVLGVIGRNGAGKSTLLKIISQITEPTEGEVHLFGRVSSLLEVGIGFHPELSGRENILLNGAILGMTRKEIRSKFDEIVAFAEIEQFIETPVKRYSSGMYVRLAFAVAAHLEPDILVVDEVLAVGDAAFQRKCLGKIEDISHSGRAVLVVSHNMSVVSQLCDEVLWLDRGQVVRRGPVREVVRAYLEQGSGGVDTWTPPPRENAPLRIHTVAIRRLHGGEGDVAGDEPFDVEFDYSVVAPLAPGRLAILVSDATGAAIFTSTSTDDIPALRAPWPLGHHRTRCRVPGHLLAPGRYFITVAEPLGDGSDILHQAVLAVTVSEQNSLAARDGRYGVIAPLLQWTSEVID